MSYVVEFNHDLVCCFWLSLSSSTNCRILFLIQIIGAARRSHSQFVSIEICSIIVHAMRGQRSLRLRCQQVLKLLPSRLLSSRRWVLASLAGWLSYSWLAQPYLYVTNIFLVVYTVPEGYNCSGDIHGETEEQEYNS